MSHTSVSDFRKTGAGGKMSRKRRYQKAVCVVLCMMLLSGCGDTKEVGKPEQKEKTTVLHWMICGEKSKSSDRTIAEFNKQLQTFLPNTEVEFEIVPEKNYKKRWAMQLATNEPLDLAWIGKDLFNYTEEVKKGNFMALDYLLSTEGKALQKEIPEKLWDKQKRDGKIYSVPILGAEYQKDYAIITSKSNMKAYGGEEEISRTNQKQLYSDQNCYAVIGDYLEYLKQQQKLGTGVSWETFSKIAQKGYEGIYGPDCPFVIRIFDEKPIVYNKYELDSYKDYFKTMSDWYHKGYIRQDIEEIMDTEEDLGKKSGYSLFLDECGENAAVFVPVSTEYETVQIPLQNYKYIPYESCRNAIAIPKTTEYPNRAMELIELLNTEEGKPLLRLLCNGFEGRHYVEETDEQIDQVTGASGKALYSLAPYTVGNVFNNYENAKGEFQQIRTWNEEAKESVLTGFELDTRMIVMEMERINLVVEEYSDVLQRGTAEDWEAIYEKMIREMKEAGSDTVIDEMQKQIDTFMQEKIRNE